MLGPSQPAHHGVGESTFRSRRPGASLEDQKRRFFLELQVDPTIPDSRGSTQGPLYPDSRGGNPGNNCALLLVL